MYVGCVPGAAGIVPTRYGSLSIVHAPFLCRAVALIYTVAETVGRAPDLVCVTSIGIGYLLLPCS